MKINATPPRSIDGIRNVQLPKKIAKSKRFRRKLRGNWKLLVIIALSVALLAIAGLFWRHMTAGQSLQGKAELQRVEKEIEKHYVLPSDEVPALATVTDKNKLTTPFFKSAQNGDKILIYQKNKIAIIYRPVIDRIIAVGPVALDAPPRGQQ
ncbi:MAG: hypothetical protein ABI602_04520 [Candidatus Saccharibacteria bacterium]